MRKNLEQQMVEYLLAVAANDGDSHSRLRTLAEAGELLLPHQHDPAWAELVDQVRTACLQAMVEAAAPAKARPKRLAPVFLFSALI